ncbi:XdhC family protein [Rhizobium paranaense]|uniref:Xanthine dehydrogenase accessory factor n=1 Tax=Rhizobium paranaense TaxID=1650438 RepID=A0A7W8XX42_9HYPH|nr:XdhC family protein [Rhizobium paranaense]MBB5576984.1 xanthine dehydrogenase accessory factor [Rhizobium paranaense]
MTDDPAEILSLAVSWLREGGVALATLIEIRGGSARSLGSQIAVASDGRYCGYISGGCVEAAVAFEAMLAISQGRDRMILLGEGSPYFDIVLPCGGGIKVAIHVLSGISEIQRILDRLTRRVPAALRYSPRSQTLTVAAPPVKSGWDGEGFLIKYVPPPRIALSGNGIEAETLSRIAAACSYDVLPLFDGDRGLDGLLDHFTAVVLLHHDLERERPILRIALKSTAFYIGALGSARTHQKRLERLRDDGMKDSDLERIRAPIGIFGPAREANSLALSILADIAATRAL